jgi:polyphosphate kinase 2 (PPK2 family)
MDKEETLRPEVGEGDVAETASPTTKVADQNTDSGALTPELEYEALMDQMRQDPDAIRHAFETGEYPYKNKMKKKGYEARKTELQTELLKVQKWARDTGRRFIILFEGRDAAGKGGTIKRFMEHLNPRTARVVALEKPTDKERGQWYFQRYVEHFPTSGEMVLFDRSWYNRAGVEKGHGFLHTQRVSRIYASIAGV